MHIIRYWFQKNNKQDTKRNSPEIIFVCLIKKYTPKEVDGLEAYIKRARSFMTNIYQFPNKNPDFAHQKRDDARVAAYLAEVTDLSRSVIEISETFDIDPRDVLLDLMYYQVGKEIQEAICGGEEKDTR